MLLRNVYFVLLVSLTITVDYTVMPVSAVNAVSRHDVAATSRRSPQQVPQLLSRVAAVARSRQFRRAFKRSLVQIFGMKKRPQRQATSGSGRVPSYMRWLYEESSSGRLPVVLRQLTHRRSASSPYRQKRHSQLTANTVRSFTGRYMQVLRWPVLHYT